MSRYVMAIDSGRCINCKACIVACQQRNDVPAGHTRNW
ncbi:MAG: 4Fe-4S binding protein, partial [Mailhella sp.]|nr:4Fe-4S binding protein [Mailhella sp.]